MYEALNDPDIILFSGRRGALAFGFSVTEDHVTDAFVVFGNAPHGFEGFAFFAFKAFFCAPDVAGIHPDGVGGIQKIGYDEIAVGDAEWILLLSIPSAIAKTILTPISKTARSTKKLISFVLLI